MRRQESCRMLCLVAMLSLATTARGEDLESLRALVRAQGVSGREEAVRQEILARLPAGDRGEVDNLGNLTVTIGSGRPLRLVLAVMDEPGYVVTRIQDDGYIRVRRLARLPLPPLFDQYFVGQPLQVEAQESSPPINAVSAVLSTHLQRGRQAAVSPPPRDEDLVVDLGARSADQARAAGIALLSPVTLEKELVELAGDRVSGFSLDDRIGCEALLRLARKLDRSRLNGQLVLAWAAQSWVGGRGAQRLARRFAPDEVILVDLYAPDPAAWTALEPGGTLGKGPFLARSGEDQGPRHLAERLRRSARDARISIQEIRFGSLNDGTPFAKHPVAVVGIPVRFPGTPAEMVDLGDLNGLSGWLKGYLEGGP
jgi:putative aminopeptidase